VREVRCVVGFRNWEGGGRTLAAGLLGMGLLSVSPCLAGTA
jgi:hypothetical protein